MSNAPESEPAAVSWPPFMKTTAILQLVSAIIDYVRTELDTAVLRCKVFWKTFCLRRIQRKLTRQETTRQEMLNRVRARLLRMSGEAASKLARSKAEDREAIFKAEMDAALRDLSR